MNHYLYEIKNNINGKIYVGVRSCKYEISKDLYMGSGKNIKLAIKIYGRRFFTKRILETFKSRKELLDREAEIVDREFISRVDTYNMALGGQGGKLFDKDMNPNTGTKRSDFSRRLMSESAKSRTWSEDGLNRRIEATRKMTKTRKRHDFSGKNNGAARKINANGLLFDTGRECASHFGITPSAVIHRIKNTSQKWDGWKYE